MTSSPNPISVLLAFEKATGHRLVDPSTIELLVRAKTNPQDLCTRPPEVPEGKVAVIDPKTGLISHYEDDNTPAMVIAASEPKVLSSL